MCVFPACILHYLVDFISVLTSCYALLGKLYDIRESVQSASKIRFPSSRIGSVVIFFVTTAVDSPAFENAGILWVGPALSRSMLPRYFEDSFLAILPLKTRELAAVCLLFDPRAKPKSFRGHRKLSFKKCSECVKYYVLSEEILTPSVESQGLLYLFQLAFQFKCFELRR